MENNGRCDICNDFLNDYGVCANEGEQWHDAPDDDPNSYDDSDPSDIASRIDPRECFGVLFEDIQE